MDGDLTTVVNLVWVVLAISQCLKRLQDCYVSIGLLIAMKTSDRPIIWAYSIMKLRHSDVFRHHS